MESASKSPIISLDYFYRTPQNSFTKKPEAFKYQTSNNKRWRYLQILIGFFAISLNKCKSKVQFVTYVLLYDKKKKLRTYQRALLGSRGASRQGAKRELMDVVCIAHINTIKDPLSFGLTVSHKWERKESVHSSCPSPIFIAENGLANYSKNCKYS